MIDEKVIDYIKASLAINKSKEEIYKELLGQGWKLEIIQENFNTFEKVVEKVGNEAINTENKESDSQKKVIKIIIIAGVIFIGAGIFSFVAANWQEMGRFIKVALIILALLASYVAGWYLKEKRGFMKTGEALFLLGAIIYGAGIFLVAQMFNISANWPDGFLLWMIGAIAMAFAADSFLIFYLSIPVGIVTLLGYPFWIFTDPMGYNNPFLLTSSLLLVVATTTTFAAGLVLRRRIPPELRELY